MRPGVLLSLLLLPAGISICVWAPGCRKPPLPPPPPPPASTLAATTQAASAPAFITDFLGVVRATYPDYPTTQPLNESTSLDEAGHFVLNQSAYIDAWGSLWIAHDQADDFPSVLQRGFDQQAYIVRQPVRFALWKADDAGTLHPLLVCQDPASGMLQWISADEHVPLGETNIDWPRASYWISAGKVIAPTRNGIILFSLGASLTEIKTERFDFPDLKSVDHAPVQILHDNLGLLIWVPPRDNLPGSRGAVRYLDGKFIPLGPDQNWPEHIVHLMPLLDGSVTQIYSDTDGSTKLGMATLDTLAVDEKHIGEVIDQLSDTQKDKRDAAFAELSQYGPGIWPMLEKRADDLPAEGKLSVEALLASKTDPRLGGMALSDGDVQVVDRLRDGSVILYARAGVTIPPLDSDETQDDQGMVIAPAWIAICPGQPVRLLDDALVRSLNPDRDHLTRALNTWLVIDPTLGPRRYTARSLETLLRKSELPFTDVLGIDRQGRWLFSAPILETTTLPSTTPADLEVIPPKTLVFDPTLPDVTSHLPVWIVPSKDGPSGWDAHNWPVIQHGGGSWALGENGWRLLNSKSETILTDPASVANFDLIYNPTTAPATLPSAVEATSSSQPTTAADDVSNPPLLVDASGTRYYDGLTTLRIVPAKGSPIIWTLPDKAVGSGKVRLIKARDGNLFLFNNPARVVKLRPTPGAPDPFSVAGVFTHHLPNTDLATRIWLDPADRIDIAYADSGANYIAILFTTGRIPRPIQLLMPADEDPEPDE